MANPAVNGQTKSSQDNIRYAINSSQLRVCKLIEKGRSKEVFKRYGGN